MIRLLEKSSCIVGTVVGRDQIKMPVAVEVGYRNGGGIVIATHAERRARCGREGVLGLPEQYAHIVGRQIRGDEIRPPITVEVGDGDPWAPSCYRRIRSDRVWQGQPTRLPCTSFSTSVPPAAPLLRGVA